MNYDQKKGHESNWESPESKGQIISYWGMQYTIENIFLRAISYCLVMFQKGLI
jgi:hypothetical protein